MISSSRFKTDFALDAAQLCKLLYRRFATGWRWRHPAGYKPAIRQVENLRYGSRAKFGFENENDNGN